MLDSLFRPEVIDAYYERWLGEPRVGNSLSSWFFVLIGIAVILSLLAVVSLGTYTRRIAISAVVLPQDGPIEVISPVAGRIVSVSLHKGDVVWPWQALVVVAPTNGAAAVGSCLQPSSVPGASGSRDSDVVLCVESEQKGWMAIASITAMGRLGPLSRRAPGSLAIVSTLDGTAVDVVVYAGQEVARGQVLARVSPSNTELVARLFASPDQLPVLHQGEYIPLRLSSTEELRPISGRIISIAPVPAPYAVTPAGPSPQAIAYAVDLEIPRSIVVPGRASLILTVGMHLSSSLPLESRPIYRWMFPSLTRRPR